MAQRKISPRYSTGGAKTAEGGSSTVTKIASSRARLGG